MQTDSSQSTVILTDISQSTVRDRQFAVNIIM